jgi:hypothetical protein
MYSILDKLVEARPLFHDDGTGILTCWHSNTNLLRTMEGLLTDGMATMEIGAGYSTVLFLHKRCFHTCITPIQDEVGRIIDYCKAEGISLDRAEFVVEQSFSVLPSMAQPKRDLIFIDGAHRFPFPIVDWFFCSMHLREGGLMIIDDTNIISCHILMKFMGNDPHWEKVIMEENFALFRKLGGHDYPFDWQGQPFSEENIDFSSDRAPQNAVSERKDPNLV